MPDSILSLHFGMFFWLEEETDDLCFCPAFKDGNADLENWGYVSEWDDFQGVDLDKLFYIHRSLVTDQVTEYEMQRH